MTQPTPIVPEWPRPHFTPSPSKASLFYLVFGEVPADLNVSRARHHVDQLPAEVTVSIHTRGDDPAWFDGWLSAPVGLEIPSVFGDDADAVRAACRVAAVRAEFQDPDSLAYLRNAVGIVSAIAEQGAVAIFDVQALTWWRPEGWRGRFVDRSEFAIGDHIFTAVSRDPGDESKTSLRTRGMTKFGRPDLLVRHLPGPPQVDSPEVGRAGDIVDGLANYLARGGLITDGQTMHLARYDTSIVLFDARETGKRTDASQPALEICDVNPQTGLSGEGIPHLLSRMQS